jgi:hypothetical protein
MPGGSGHFFTAQGHSRSRRRDGSGGFSLRPKDRLAMLRIFPPPSSHIPNMWEHSGSREDIKEK